MPTFVQYVLFAWGLGFVLVGLLILAREVHLHRVEKRMERAFPPAPIYSLTAARRNGIAQVRRSR